MEAWVRVRGNKGARSAGVDGQTAYSVEKERGTDAFLRDVREQLRSRTFRPLPVRERMIPKPGSRTKRRLGIPTVTDRVVQASLKLVLEPIFEADFQPCSYGFRPKRRAHDAVAETRHLTSHPRNYEWIVEGDITACFDEIDHTALMDRVRRRVGDKRVLALVKAFLKAGILSKDEGLAGSCRRCCPTSHCRSSTSTSSGSGTVGPSGTANSDAAKGSGPGGSFATRTTS
jgi:RNA-directed DNA polymerase